MLKFMIGLVLLLIVVVVVGVKKLIDWWQFSHSLDQMGKEYEELGMSSDEVSEWKRSSKLHAKQELRDQFGGQSSSAEEDIGDDKH